MGKSWFPGQKQNQNKNQNNCDYIMHDKEEIGPRWFISLVFLFSLGSWCAQIYDLVEYYQFLKIIFFDLPI